MSTSAHRRRHGVVRPHGAGKTLTLDIVAGFVRADEGRVMLDEEILFDGATQVHLAPHARHCGYVFQNYALFPHMTMRENLNFAATCAVPVLASRGYERHRKVNEMNRALSPGGCRRTQTERGFRGPEHAALRLRGR
jgi:ABC-type sulfate/molybdate transport systems ATPase subunit